MTNTSMTPLEIAQQRIDECRETRSAELDLSQLGLDVIPDEVFELTWLERLDVSENFHRKQKCGNIKEIPPAIKQLTALSFFNCSNNRISDLTSLNGLPALTTLDCRDNQIRDLAPLNGLTALVKLICRANRINDLRDLRELPALTSFDCRSNRISDLTPLKELVALIKLNCRDNQISDLTPLGELPALSILDCSNNSINDLIPLRKLSALTRLRCLDNKVSDLAPLEGLMELATLDCSNNPIEDLMPLRGLPALTTLRCRNSHLRDLTALKELMILTTLDCSNNTIDDLMPIKDLLALKTLYCRDTKISDLTPLSGLKALATLDCSNNPISDLTPLEGLTTLVTLYCRDSQISDLRPLSKLTMLVTLDCSNNSISSLTSLTGLTVLASLYCRNNQISDLKSLSGLANLLNLNFSDNQVSDLEPLSGLVALVILYFSNNQISDLTPLNRLNSLATLDCSDNSVVDLTPLTGMTALGTLYCRNNQISDLSPLSGMTTLGTFYCSNNQIRDLMPLSGLDALSKLNCRTNQISNPFPLYGLVITEQLKTLSLHGNPIYGVPSEILTSNCVTSLKNYWLDMKQGAEQHYQLKVQLVGNGRVGKTTLADALEKKRAPDEVFESTHGITLKNIPLMMEDENESVTLQLWDFGGQEIYHSTHRLFLSDDCLYLLLWAEETEEQLNETRHPVSYWLESIHDLGANSPVILVKNQIDRADHLPERPPDLTDDLPGVRQIHQAVKISAFKYLKMNALRGGIRDVISELKHKVCLTLPRSWLQVETALETLKEKSQQRTIPFAHFRQLCIKAGVNDPIWFAGYLHKAGVFFYREGTFQNQIILNQNWAIEAVYKLFDPQEHRPKLERIGGKFEGWHTPAFWPNTEEAERKIYLDFMRNCGICYEPNRQRNTPFDEREFVIPALLPENCSAVSAWQKTDSDWQLEIKYTFLHRSIIDRIIMRIGEAYSGTAWRNGIFCNTENGQLLLECTYSNREVSNQGQLTFHLRGQHLDKLLYALRKLVQSVSPHRRYQEYLQKGSNAEYEVLSEFKEVDNTEDPFEEKNIVSNTIKLFISYSHNDENPYRIELEKRLKAIQRKFPELQSWQDRNLLAGEQVHKKILQELEEADIVVLLISPDFINSDYCFSHEMEVALKQYEENKNIVIPVIIRTTADWSDFQIGNHTALPTDGKPLAKWDDQDEFWADVQTGISKQVERLVKR